MKWIMNKKRHAFACIPKAKVCACGCPGRHTIGSMLGMFAWSMKIMLGGEHPLTRHGLQPLDAQRFLLVGRPWGFSGGLFPARGDWAWYQQTFAFPYWSGTMICWIRKSI